MNKKDMEFAVKTAGLIKEREDRKLKMEIKEFGDGFVELDLEKTVEKLIERVNELEMRNIDYTSPDYTPPKVTC